MEGNLFSHTACTAATPEFFETLLERPGLRIERIVSHGQASPPGFWFDQGQAEFVVLLSGQAILRFEDETDPRQLKAGDWLYIAPRRRHRVEWTAESVNTRWLAIHFPESCQALSR